MTTNYLADGFICILARPPPDFQENRIITRASRKSVLIFKVPDAEVKARKSFLWRLKSQKEKPTNALVGLLQSMFIIAPKNLWLRGNTVIKVGVFTDVGNTGKSK